MKTPLRPLVGAFLQLLTLSGCEKAGAPTVEGHDSHSPSAASSKQEGHEEHSVAVALSATPASEPKPGVDAVSTPAASEPLGYSAFTLDRARAMAVGLRLAPVEQRSFSKVLRTTGVVILDETRTSHVHTKVRGWIENVIVDFVGKSVRAGTPLCAIYSQEVLGAQLEFLAVLDQAGGRAELSGSMAEAETQAREGLLAAARRRLALWDVPAGEIERLEASRTPSRTFTLKAPRSGIVVSKQALAGMYVDPSVELYLISDVSKLWMLVDVYESEVPWVKLGAQAMLRVEGLDGEERQAEVAFIPPTVEEATRTLKVRFNLDNPDGRLRPGAFATVELKAELGQALAIPEDAVIHAGRQAIVFVVMGERIEPRSATLGPLVDGYYRVDQGLQAGESVAVGAQFLIDSESRLRATSGKGPGHGGH